MSQQLLNYFDEQTRATGKEKFKQGKVLAFKCSNETLMGSVYSSDLFLVEIKMSGKYIVLIKCSSPECNGACAHAAALVFAYLNSRGELVEAAEESPIPRFKPQAQRLESPARRLESEARRLESPAPRVESPTSRLEPLAPSTDQNSATSNRLLQKLEAGMRKTVRFEIIQFFDYMREIQKDANTSVRDKNTNSRQIFTEQKSESKQFFTHSVSNEEIRYVISSESFFGRPEILLKLVRREKGAVASSRLVGVDEILERRAAFSVLDQRVAETWRALLSMGERVFDSTRDVYTVPSDPEDLETLLVCILETGRAHYNDVTGPQMRWGGKRKAQLVWERQMNHEVKLSIVPAGVSRNVKLLNWCVPWYIDPADCSCGSIFIDGPEEVLTAFSRMRSGFTRSEERYLSYLIYRSNLQSVVPPPLNTSLFVCRTQHKASSLTFKIATTREEIRGTEGLIASFSEPVKVAVVTSGKQSKDVVRQELDGQIVAESTVCIGLNEIVERLEKAGFLEIEASCLKGVDKSNRYFIADSPKNWIALSKSDFIAIRSSGCEISTNTEIDAAPILLDQSHVDFDFLDNRNSELWFSESSHIELDGNLIPLLPILTTAIRRIASSGTLTAASIDQLNVEGRFVATLPDGRIVMLPFERVRFILNALKDLVLSPNPANIALLNVAALLSDSSLSQENWIGQEKMNYFADRLRGDGRTRWIEPPTDFRAKLRNYQSEGLQWLQAISRENFGGILADDMGLGKTVQLISHICVEHAHGRLSQPMLVVCPTSVLPNWLLELDKFAPHLRVLALHGATRFRNFDEIRNHDVVLTTYGLLTRDADELHHIRWHGVILDESQVIKNYATKTAKAARRLKASHRVCVSGTPIENSLSELWSQFQFAMPGLLGDKATFDSLVKNRIERENDISIRRALKQRITPFMLRRDKSEVSLDLPEKIEILKKIALKEGQRDLYETIRLASTQRVRDEIDAKGFKQSQFTILDALLKLRQVCCDPNLLKIANAQGHKSAKLETLREMLIELVSEGRKAIVFSQFTSMLDLIATELDKHGLKYVQLRGNTADRATPVNEFQHGETPIFLISLKAGGVGLNLTAADTVIHYDPWWNPAVEQQATDRAHRIGQQKTVFVYKLIAEGTIEERMIEMQERKNALSNCIYSEDGQLSSTLDEQDILLLLDS